MAKSGSTTCSIQFRNNGFKLQIRINRDGKPGFWMDAEETGSGYYLIAPQEQMQVNHGGVSGCAMPFEGSPENPIKCLRERLEREEQESKSQRLVIRHLKDIIMGSIQNREDNELDCD
jgi:hypothetical protein